LGTSPGHGIISAPGGKIKQNPRFGGRNRYFR